MTKAEARHALDKARHAIVMKFPFIGEISLRMDLVPTKDAKNPTSTSDGSKVYIDMEFMSKLRKEELSFVIGHEVWHNVLLHPARKQTRDQKLFDLACDMEVNWLMQQNNKDCAFSMPYDAPLPPRELQGEAAETIYDWLMQHCQKKNGKGQEQQQDGCPQAGMQDSSSQTGSSSSSKDNIGGSSSKKNDSAGNCDSTSIEELPSQSSQQSQSNGGESVQSQQEWECPSDEKIDRQLKSQPKKNKSLDGQFDVHMYTDGSEKKEDDGSGNVDNDFKPKMSKSFCEEMREATMTQLQKCALNQGTLPVGMEQFLKKLEKPEVPWQEQLAQFVTQIHTGKLEWTPPSRRHLYQDLYLQSHRTKKITIALGIDTSGSTYNILPNFFAEMESLMKSFDGYTIHRIDCDCAVEKHIVYDSESAPFTKDESKGIDWAGGGGTSFSPVIDFIENNNLEIDALVYLTDGYGDVYDNPPPYPVLWVLPKDGNKDFCTWGKKLILKNASGGWN